MSNNHDWLLRCKRTSSAQCSAIPASSRRPCTVADVNMSCIPATSCELLAGQSRVKAWPYIFVFSITSSILISRPAEASHILHAFIGKYQIPYPQPAQETLPAQHHHASKRRRPERRDGNGSRQRRPRSIPPPAEAGYQRRSATPFRGSRRHHRPSMGRTSPANDTGARQLEEYHRSRNPDPGSNSVRRWCSRFVARPSSADGALEPRETRQKDWRSRQ